MTYPSVEHTFVASTYLDATEVNTNFSNVIDGISDSTKDLKVAVVATNNVDSSASITAGTSVTTGLLEVFGLTKILGAVTTSNFIAQVLNFDYEALTIAAGSITPVHSLVEVNGEAGLADDLSTIVGAVDGHILMLYKKSTSGNITIKNSTGNILCGSDRVMSTNSLSLLIYDGTQSKWNLLMYQAN
jgi:hypothetical protein